MQGQEAKHPYVGLWSRVEGFAGEELNQAVADRDVVRATLFRGTLHLVTAEDYLRFRTTMAPMLEAGLRMLKERAEGLDAGKVVAAAEKLLAKEPLTFTEVRDALQEQFPAVNERALGFCTRMMVPLVMYPDGHPLGLAGERAVHAGGGVAGQEAASGPQYRRSLSSGIWKPSARRRRPTSRPGPGCPEPSRSSTSSSSIKFQGRERQDPVRRTGGAASGSGHPGARQVPAGVRQPAARARQTRADHRRRTPPGRLHQEPPGEVDVHGRRPTSPACGRPRRSEVWPLSR